MQEGIFPKAEKAPPEMPDPLATYAAVAMRPRQAFQPVPLDALEVRNATPFRSAP
jgi:hypothetical protein